MPVKKTLRKMDQPAPSTECYGQAENGDITAAEMLTRQTSPPVALTLPSLKTKTDDARLGQ